MHHHIVFGLLATLALSGCAATSYSHNGHVYPMGPHGYEHEGAVPMALSAAEQENARRIVTASLKDPSSATFGPRIVGGRSPDGFSTICGTVNAKNGFGGFNGMQPFKIINWEGTFRDDVDIGTGDTTILVLQMCERGGAKL